MPSRFYKKNGQNFRNLNSWFVAIALVVVNAIGLHNSSISWANTQVKKTTRSTSARNVTKQNNRTPGVRPKDQGVSKRSLASASTRKTTENRSQQRGIASDSDKALEVRGQSRNLSLMLVLKNNKESLDFVQPRSSFRKEIQNTNY